MIRKISIGKDVRDAIHFVLNAEKTVFISDNKTDKRFINEIKETEFNYLIYVKSKETNEVQLWKKVPKNDFVHVEYIVD
jgi:hypothetical protein